MSPQITETTYGAIRGAHALGSSVASGAAGYIVNRQANTKLVSLYRILSLKVASLGQH